MKRHLDFTAGVVAGSALPAALRGLIQHAKRLPVVLMGSTVLGAALGEAADVSDTARALGFDQVLFVKRLTYNSNHYYTEYINSAWKPGGNLCVNW